MLQLRLRNGIDFTDFAARTGFDARALYPEQIARLAELHLIECDATGFHLSKAGINVADAVAAEFLCS